MNSTPELYNNPHYDTAAAAAVAAPAGYTDAAYPSYADNYAAYPPQAYAPYESAPAGYDHAATGPAVLSSNPAAAAAGLGDGMMVRVKVGFVRSLEDELGESHVLHCRT